MLDSTADIFELSKRPCRTRKEQPRAINVIPTSAGRTPRQLFLLLRVVPPTREVSPYDIPRLSCRSVNKKQVPPKFLEGSEVLILYDSLFPCESSLVSETNFVKVIANNV